MELLKCQNYPYLKIKMIEMTKIYKRNICDALTPYGFIFYYITPLLFSNLPYNPLMIFNIYT